MDEANCQYCPYIKEEMGFLVFQRSESLLHLFTELCKVRFDLSLAIFARVLEKKKATSEKDWGDLLEEEGSYRHTRVFE